MSRSPFRSSVNDLSIRQIRGCDGRPHQFLDATGTGTGEDAEVTMVRVLAPTLPPPIARGSGMHALSGITIAGRYVIGRRLGEGSFGTVYRADDLQLGREVAIKVMNATAAANPRLVGRFLREARAMARISHPSVVTVFDCGVDPSRSTAFIAMELLSGETLSARLARTARVPPSIAISLGIQLADALDAAHRVGVLHRDLKPDNIFLVPDPATAIGERVEVIDFGLAKLCDPDARHHTQTDALFGTPCYMPPEQWRSSAATDRRTDIYALGCILFELVAGRPPFTGSVADLMAAHQHATTPRPSAFCLDVPPQFDAVVCRLLHKEPSHRPQSMADVRQLLAGLPRVEAPVALIDLPPPSLAARSPQKPPSRAWSSVVSTIAIALAFVAMAAFVAVVTESQLSRTETTATGHSP